MSKTVIAFAGLGTIGTGLARMICENQQAGELLQIKTVLVRDAAKKRPYLPKEARLTTKIEDLLKDPEVQVIVELMGGVEAAFSVVTQALRAGKHVVTANKNLIAEKGPEIFALAKEKNLTVGFEASVCGGIPIIRTLRESLRGDTITSIEGIVNGTTNYILTRMSEEKCSYAEALKGAQEKGFAEPDPHYDVSGKDAAYKIAILATLAFGTYFSVNSIPTTGIETLEAQDVSQADVLGYQIKLVGKAKKSSKGCLDAEVSPVLVPKGHPLASIRMEYNAVLVESEGLGRTLYSGKGAGPSPTSVSLLADLLDVAQNRALSVEPGFGFLKNPSGTEETQDQISRFYLRFTVPDRPGVLAKVTGELAAQEISLASVIQPASPDQNGLVPLILTTHEASRARLVAALEQLSRENWSTPVVLRIQEA